MTAVVGILGSSGFIGNKCVEAIQGQGFCVRRILTPRLVASDSSPGGLRAASASSAAVAQLAQEMTGLTVVVNAAGISDAAAARSGELFGANSLLPIVAARASDLAGVRRLVHVSSAAVQGRLPILDESARYTPFSPYSHSKAMAEMLLQESSASLQLVIYRPTSVHGRERRVTMRLAEFARSPWSSVAGSGHQATPQVLVENVAAGVGYCTRKDVDPPRFVLQPWEGLDCAKLLEILGRGRRPRSVAVPAARSLVYALRRFPVSEVLSRRLEMLWMGQGQARSWLDSQSWEPVADGSGWRALAEQLWLDERSGRTKSLGR